MAATTQHVCHDKGPTRTVQPHCHCFPLPAACCASPDMLRRAAASGVAGRRKAALTAVLASTETWTWQAPRNKGGCKMQRWRCGRQPRRCRHRRKAVCLQPQATVLYAETRGWLPAYKNNGTFIGVVAFHLSLKIERDGAENVRLYPRGQAAR